MAFLAFAGNPIDVAIYEVGLGGRFDATNIVVPEVSVITSIDFDHKNFLGNSIAQIAAEKAGIVKRGVPVVSASTRQEARAVIARRCAEMDARLLEIEEEWQVREPQISGGFYRTSAVSRTSGRTIEVSPSLPGRFQISNALAAASAAHLLAEHKFRIGDNIYPAGSQLPDGPDGWNACAKIPLCTWTARIILPAQESCCVSGMKILKVAVSFLYMARCAIKPWTKSPICFSRERMQ